MTHIANEVLILVEPGSLIRVPAATSDIGRARLYAAVTKDTTLEGTHKLKFTNQGTGLIPYSPVHVGGGFNAAGDAILTWTRRTRVGGDWLSGSDVPLSEAGEMYQVFIYDYAGFFNVLRIVNCYAPTLTYPVADQIDDFGAPQTTLYYEVAQMSATVGKGDGARGCVCASGPTPMMPVPAPRQFLY